MTGRGKRMITVMEWILERIISYMLHNLGNDEHLLVRNPFCSSAWVCCELDAYSMGTACVI